jgi:hypothetical protein
LYPFVGKRQDFSTLIKFKISAMPAISVREQFLESRITEAYTCHLLDDFAQQFFSNLKDCSPLLIH